MPALDELGDPDPTTVEDERFDRVYPDRIRRLSSIFWTPVHIAAQAAELLDTAPETRVLDVGCGPGKFCLLAASLTEGRFTGVEQRRDLIDAAKAAAAHLQLADVEFLHANIVEVPFAAYDAFYVFNPFEENMHQGYRIDSSVAQSPELFKTYTSYVADQLGKKPIGTRVVTYMGYGEEIPRCYSCERALFGEDLKLWIKTREYEPEIEQLRLGPSRSYRGSFGWAPPRNA